VKNLLRTGWLLALACVAAATAAEPSAHLSVARKADGTVVATVTGTVRACGITALEDEPTFTVNGNIVDVKQPTAGVGCMNPPPQSKPYRHSVDLGKLPAGTYTIRWNFPELSTTYTVK